MKKQYLKRALAATVALCMTAGLCMWGGAEIPSTVQAASLVNLAPSATITTMVRDTDSDTYQDPTKVPPILARLNDGKKDKAAPELWRGGFTATAKGAVGDVGDYYEFTWNDPVSINRVDLYFWKTLYSAPSAWHVDVKEDGTNWKTVGTVIDADMDYVWNTSVLSRELTFKLQENVRALRVYIDKGYLEGAGYGIHEIEIFSDPDVIEAEGTNLAPSATITTMVRDTDSDTYQDPTKVPPILAKLNDGNKASDALWRGGLKCISQTEVSDVGDYYEFTWKNTVCINRIDLYYQQRQYQVPNAWHIVVTEDGNNWRTVGAVIDAETPGTWSEVVGSKELTFKLQENVRALRVYIDNGYLGKAGVDSGVYGIFEIEMFNDPDAVVAKGINLAPSATLTTEARDADYPSIKNSTTVATTLATLTDKDGDAKTLWRNVGTQSEAGQASEVGDYYQFTWHRPISVNKVDLVFGTAKEETPADWHVEVTKNGTDWTNVGNISNTVANPGEELRQELSFDLQEEVTALRVYIDTAYMNGWGGYALREIEIYHEKVALNGHSLVADGITKLNFFYDLGLNQTEIKDEGSYITFEIPGVKSLQKIRFKDAEESEHGYKFQYSIPAKHMADKIKATLYIEGLKYEQSYEYSITEYANSIVNGKEYNEKDKALARQMLHYGAYAQQYFSYNTENLANEELGLLDLSSVTADSFSTVIEGNVLTGDLGSIVASHLTLDAETTLHLYFRPAAGVNADTLTFMYNGQFMAASKYTSNQETWLHIAIPNIAAHALSETQEVIVSYGTSKDTLKYSALTYGYNVLKNSAYNSKTALQNLVKALYLYNNAAVSKKNYNELNYTKIIAGANYILDWYDDFEGKKLDSTRWLDESLPHRSTSAVARKAKYTMKDGVLKLYIDRTTPNFYDGSEGGLRTSGIQTYSVNDLHTYGTVNNVQPFNGYTTKYGYFEMRCKMPSCGGGGAVAWWLTGTDPETMSRDDYMSQNANGNWVERNNGEIDIVETLFSETNVHEPKVHAWQDSGLKDWFGQDDSKVTLEGDYINDWHTYAMNWTPTELIFYVDGVEVRKTNQSPQYEMCMYLNVYANDASDYWAGGPSNDIYPKEWQIDYIRVYKAADGYAN